MPTEIDLIAEELDMLVQFMDDMSLNYDCIYIVDVGSGRQNHDKLKQLQKMVNAKIKICVCWTPSVNTESQGNEDIFINELNYDMKNGLPGSAIMPIGIAVSPKWVTAVEKFLSKQKEIYPDKKLPPVFVEE